jgi:hypothetical protein
MVALVVLPPHKLVVVPLERLVVVMVAEERFKEEAVVRVEEQNFLPEELVEKEPVVPLVWPDLQVQTDLVVAEEGEHEETLTSHLPVEMALLDFYTYSGMFLGDYGR